jgi:hypothetical protein
VSSYVRWQDIRAEQVEQVERAGGEAVVAAGKAKLLAHPTRRMPPRQRRA